MKDQYVSEFATAMPTEKEPPVAGNKASDCSADLICTVDKEGTFVHIGRSLKRVWGYQSWELEGKDFADVIVENDRLITRQFAVHVKDSGEPGSFEIRCRHKNGNKVPLVWTLRWCHEESLFYCTARHGIDKLIKERHLHLQDTRLQHAYKLADLAWWEYDVASESFTVSTEIFQMFGLPLADSDQLSLFEFLNCIYKEDRARLESDLFTLSEDVYINYEHRVAKPSGEIITVRHYSEVVRDPVGNPVAIIGVAKDITETKYYHRLEKLEREILEMNAAGNKRLGELLDYYMKGLESLHPGMICSVLKKKGNQLFNLSAPGLPKDYCRLLEGIYIGNNVGSCGTAAFLKESVYVTDTQNDARWERIKQIAAKYQIGACLSQPIFDSKGQVIATFAGYYRTPKKPSRLEENTLQRTGQFLRILLESHEKEEALRESNLRYELATRATNDAVFDWDTLNDVVKWGEGLCTNLGYQTSGALTSSRAVLKCIHPKDVRHLVETISTACSCGRTNWSGRFRLRKVDGTFAYLTGKASIIFNQAQQVIRIVGAIRDVTEEIRQERRLAFIAKATTEVIWEEKLGSEKSFMDVQKLNKMFGYDLTNNVVHHSFWSDKVNSADSAAMLGHRKRCIEEGVEQFVDDFRLRKQDGKWAYIRNRTHLVKDMDGNPVALVGAMDDITEKVRLQRKLIREKIRHQQNITKAAIEAQENERSEIGKELHDNINQMLAAAKLYIQNIHHYPDHGIELANKSANLVQSCIDEVRKLSRALVSPTIRDMSFEDALLELVESYRELKTFDVGYHFSFDEDRIEPGLRLTVYRILQELFNNTVKYANASYVHVVIRSTAKELPVSFRDDGNVFDISNTREGLGLSNIRNRVNTYHGKVSMTSSIGNGLETKICFPI